MGRLGYNSRKFKMKRVLDILGASVGLLFFSPVLILVSFKIYREMGFPIFFRQARPGMYGKPFEMIKFRTMNDVIDVDGQLLPDGDRLTEFGKFLRTFSLDELPELWNVLKGEMSLVGPRPLLMEYLRLYSPEQARRHVVPPGITGWAQVNGRNAISWEEKLSLDIWYVDNQSLWLDIKIIFLTVKKVIKREGISAKGEATMSKFEGTKK